MLVTAFGLWAAGAPVSDGTGVAEAAAANEPQASPIIQSYKLPPASAEPGGDRPAATAPEAKKPTFFVYHSHNRESWLPELPSVTKPNLAFHPEHNITLLGERLARQFEDFGFESVHSKVDYNERHKDDYPHYDYYAYSRTTIKEALAVHRDELYLIDIHRDSQGRELTTVAHDGKDYAQVYFVVGTAHKDWELNEAYAKRIHEKLNEAIPDLSRGIYLKSKKEGDGVYNQDLSSNSVLIEIGGVENTLEESYRTVDLLARIMRDLHLEDNGTTRM